MNADIKYQRLTQFADHRQASLHGAKDDPNTLSRELLKQEVNLYETIQEEKEMVSQSGSSNRFKNFVEPPKRHMSIFAKDEIVVRRGDDSLPIPARSIKLDVSS